jgi:carboxyl-terminal processing protease
MKKLIYFAPLPILMAMTYWAFLPAKSRIPQYAALLPDTALLKPAEVHTKKALVVTNVINYNHYIKKQLNDDVSKATYEAYLDALDGSKMYFLAEDLQKFEKYRTELDDDLKEGNVHPAYDIFNLYKQRVLERIDKVLKMIEVPTDFTVDETWDADPKKKVWAKANADLDEEWRKYLKNQMLNLKLSGKKAEEIRPIIQKRYERFRKTVTQINSEDVFQTFMNCLTESYDPHTNYFSPISSQNFNMNMSRSFEGIGARLTTEDDYTMISEIMPGGPAFKGKELKANDKIIAVAQGDNGDFEDVIGWRLDDVVQLIRGQKGSVVRLRIIPAGSAVGAPSQVVRLVRDKIKIEEESAIKKVISHTYNGKTTRLGVIEIPSFYLDFKAYQAGDKDYKSTSRDVKKLLEELQAENIEGVIIDLRNNGGGSLKEAIDLTGLFIKQGPVVQVRNANGSIDIGDDEDPTIAYNGPLAVMVNGFSASASEIFAGAIQDYKRGIIIGEQTFGKGTVQSPVDLTQYIKGEKGNQGQLNITLSKYYRVTGSSTQNVGVKPDIMMQGLYDKSEYSESSERAALPWDEIKSARFESTDKISSKDLTALVKSYEKRQKTDPELKELLSNIEDWRKLRKNTKISLQEEKRKKEIEEYEKKQSEKVQLDEEEVESEIKTDNKARKDLYLQNALTVLAEFLNRK